MQDFWFYLELGFHHVMDPGAYDHVLFLVALAVPFSFKSWKRVVVLATLFTVAHCLSLAFSAYGLVNMNIGLIEFLIPITILATALFNVFYSKGPGPTGRMNVHVLATTFFGLIHGFGFSNYFNLLMAEEPDKLVPLIGFATGIEISQILVIFGVLLVAFAIQRLLGVKSRLFSSLISIIVALITIPLLIKAFPW